MAVISRQRLAGLASLVWERRIAKARNQKVTTLITPKTAPKWLQMRGASTLTLGLCGFGKSYSAESLILIDIFSCLHGVCVCDPESTLINSILQSAELGAAVFQGRVSYISAENPYFGFNILSPHPGVDLIDILANTDSAPFTDTMSKVLQGVVPALQSIDATLLDLVTVLTHEKSRQEVVQRLEDLGADRLLVVNFIQALTIKDQRVINGILSRLHKLLSHPYVQLLFCNRQAPFDLPQIVQSSVPPVLLIALSDRYEGVPLPEHLIKLIAQVFTKMLQTMIMQRQENEGVPIFFYLDEMQDIASASVKSLYIRARKRRFHIYGLTQTLQNLDTKLRGGILGSVNSLQVFRCSPADAEILAATLNLKNLESATGDSKSSGFYGPQQDLLTLSTLPKYNCVLRTNDRVQHLDLSTATSGHSVCPLDFDLRPLHGQNTK